MSLGTAFRGLAGRLVRQFGKTVTLTISRPGGYDVTTRSATPMETASNVKGVIGEYRTDQGQGPTRQTREGQVERQDFPVWVAAVDVSERPAPGDLVTIDGDRMRVVTVRTTYATDKQVLYELQVRQ